MRFGLEQAQSTCDQHAVDVRIDLCEIGRLEGHVNPKVGQIVRELWATLVHQFDGVGALDLQPPLHSMLLCKSTQARFVGCA